MIVLAAIGAVFGACGDDEPAGGGSAGSGGSAAGADGSAGSSASGGSGGTGGTSGSGGSAGSGGIGASCGSCGDARTKVACNAQVAACLQDPGCKAIRDCVYGSVVGCSLGENGAKCAEECVAKHCATAQSGKLFLEAEQCAYCQGDCASLCGTYCGAFTITPDTVICTNPIDAGAEGGDADIDASDAASDASDAASDAPDAASDAASD